MRYGIVSDIHGNLEAFTAALTVLETQGGIDMLWCLGDVVGYGANPRECLELLRRYRHLCVMGNHEYAVIGKADIRWFNAAAARAVEWTSRQLSDADNGYLAGLPFIVEAGGITLVHGSPGDPIWEYLITTVEARENFGNFSTQCCLVGHSHIPAVFVQKQGDKQVIREHCEMLSLADHTARYIINLGSVGQPRDGDPGAAFALYDSNAEEIRFFRVAYDIGMASDKIRKAGLPARLADRLAYGL